MKNFRDACGCCKWLPCSVCWVSDMQHCSAATKSIFLFWKLFLSCLELYWLSDNSLLASREALLQLHASIWDNSLFKQIHVNLCSNWIATAWCSWTDATVAIEAQPCRSPSRSFILPRWGGCFGWEGFSVGGSLVAPGTSSSIPTRCLGGCWWPHSAAHGPWVGLDGGSMCALECRMNAKNVKLTQVLRHRAWEQLSQRNQSGRNDRHPCHAYFFILFFLQLNEAVYVISAVNSERIQDLATVPA